LQCTFFDNGAVPTIIVDNFVVPKVGDVVDITVTGITNPSVAG